MITQPRQSTHVRQPADKQAIFSEKDDPKEEYFSMCKRNFHIVKIQNLSL
jgi:hypothetical protein